MSDAVAPACARQCLAEVLLNEPIARETYRIRFELPEIARTILPGQFLMIRPTSAVSAGAASDPFLGRPFALYDVVHDGAGRPFAVDVVYLILGRGTAALARCRPGERLSLWGPLGNGFGPPPAEGSSAVFVAGGIGQTPFLALGKWWRGQQGYGQAITGADFPWNTPFCDRAELLYGVRSAELAAGISDFEQAGIAVKLATDDGSAGHHGFVTDLLKQRIWQDPTPTRIVGCGPVPMLRALSSIVAETSIDCDVSLESPMACGFGACFSCVIPIRQDDGTADLRRICVEGPIFPARSVVWA